MERHTEEYREGLRKEIEVLQKKESLLQEMNIKLKNGEDVTDLNKQYKLLEV
ncbi:hypothetical protein D1872_267120 [compost metagenome]